MSEPEGNSSLWKIVLLLEVVALAIALILPVTPSKTGSDTELADYLLTEPTYIEKVAVYFVLLNIVLVLIWLTLLVRNRLVHRKSSGVDP